LNETLVIHPEISERTKILNLGKWEKLQSNLGENKNI